MLPLFAALQAAPGRVLSRVLPPRRTRPEAPRASDHSSQRQTKGRGSQTSRGYEGDQPTTFLEKKNNYVRK